MKARIVEVMESWPLQLILDSDGEQLFVDLDADVRVERAGVEVGPGTLSPGHQVELADAPSLDRHASSRALPPVTRLKILG